MVTAISVVAVVEDVEHHSTLTFLDPHFLLRNTDTGLETTMNSLDVIDALLAPFAAEGPAFIAVIDHVGETCDIGFVARRYRSRWSDITASDAPHSVSWHDIESELWAALVRLVAATRRHS